MEFKHFNQKIQTQFAVMCNTGKLFRSKVTGREVWETYLSSFDDEKIFRDPESSEHNCNCCKNFIRRYGNIVAIDSNGELISMFTDLGDCGEYANSVKACALLLDSSSIQDVFFETYRELDQNLNYESCDINQDSFKLGIESNHKKYTQEEVDKFGVVNTDDVYQFHHFCINLPKQFVNHSGNSIEQITAIYRDKYNVFKRAMEEIPLDTLNLVRDLINQGSLLDGTAHIHAIDKVIEEKKKFELCKESETIDNWLWSFTYDLDERIAKFKNTLIGVLCTELAEGVELNKACENWNKRVDPVNYHKAKAPITKRQIEQAKMFVEENGYAESFNRRLATIEDIKASEILHMNATDTKIKEVSMFDNVKATSTRHKRSEFEKLEEVSIEKFMSDILPSCTSIEAYLENRMESNLVTMTKSIADEAKQITKWNNISTNYSWTFNGNLAGKSQIEQAIKDRGGDTSGVLNVRLHFPNSTNDYDLCISEPNGSRITYNYVRHTFPSSGRLDLDAQGVDGNYPPEKRVENINYTDINKMPKGTYSIEIDNYGGGSNNGFFIEVKTNDSISLFEYNGALNGKRNKVMDIHFNGSEFAINNLASKLIIKQSDTISKEIWGIETNNFHKVNLVCKSPNHWGDNSVGNLHYFFMLDNCKAKGSIRSFHNENLLPDLLKHRKVMEVLGSTNMIESTEKQLSGVGFNSTVKDELIVRLQGTHKRTLKIKF
jgi:hypothetical protein